MNKMDAEQLYKERVQRVRDAIALKEPDRVPIAPWTDIFFPALQVGMNHKQAMYKGKKYAKAATKVYSRYDWDLYPPLLVAGLGKLFDGIGHATIKWPGAANPALRLENDQPYQYIEKPWMEASDYDAILKDPTGFLLRKIMPIHNTSLSILKKFPQISEMAMMFNGAHFFFLLIDKELKKTIKSYKRTLLKMIGGLMGMGGYIKKMKKKGNPVSGESVFGQAPFDMISDSLRGMRGTMMDMYRNPEELKELCNRLVEPAITAIETSSFKIGSSETDTIALSFIPLHRGADGFMSNEQFEEFYWPSLTKIMEGMIKKDIIPMPFFEGRYGDRLEYLAEFAKKHPAKMVYWFHDTDIIKVKEMMGDYVTIKGNVPASLLVGGPPSAVEEYVKKSIEGCMEGGGYLVDGGVSGIPNEAKHENVQAMTNAVHKYGVYRK
jgi:hypothetical protein